MNSAVDELVKQALAEDIPSGDITTQSLGLPVKFGRAKLISKDDFVLSGTTVFSSVFKRLDPNCKLQWFKRNSEMVLTGQTICLIEGTLGLLIQAERVAINFLAHLSGVATMTKLYVKETEGTSTRILDTRKTLPGLRELQKAAVRDGGGYNHRMNLSAAVLIKENHIAMAGGIEKAVQKIRKHYSGHIEVETRTLEDVKVAIEVKADRILLDNMSNEMMAQAIQMIPVSIETEASGNMTIDRIASVAQLGVNFISVGALTHSAPSVDVSLLFEGLAPV